MLKSARYRVVAYSFLAPAFLAGCGSAPHSAVATNASSVATNPPVSAPGKPPCTFTLDTPVDRIAADPNGKAVLERDMPGLMASKEYPLFDDMSLSQIAIMSGGRISKDKLSLVQSDLQVSDLSP